MKKIYLLSIALTLALANVHLGLASDSDLKRSAGQEPEERVHKKVRIKESLSPARRQIIGKVADILQREHDKKPIRTRSEMLDTLTDYTRCFTDQQCSQVLESVQSFYELRNKVDGRKNSFPDELECFWKSYFENEQIRASSPEEKICTLMMFGFKRDVWVNDGSDKYFGILPKEYKFPKDSNGLLDYCFSVLVEDGIELVQFLKTNKKVVGNIELFLDRFIYAYSVSAEYDKGYEPWTDLKGLIFNFKKAVEFGSTHNLIALLDFPEAFHEFEEYFRDVKQVLAGVEGVFCNADDFRKVNKLSLAAIKVASKQESLKGQSFECILAWCRQIPKQLLHTDQIPLYLKKVPGRYLQKFNALLDDMDLEIEEAFDDIMADRIQLDNFLKLIDLLDSNPARREPICNLVERIELSEDFRGQINANSQLAPASDMRFAWIGSDKGFKTLGWFFKLDQNRNWAKADLEKAQIWIVRLGVGKSLDFLPIPLLEWFAESTPEFYRWSYQLLILLQEKIPTVYLSDQGLDCIKCCFLHKTRSFTVVELLKDSSNVEPETLLMTFLRTSKDNPSPNDDQYEVVSTPDIYWS